MNADILTRPVTDNTQPSNDRTNLILFWGLMVPLIMRVFDLSIFRVALPTIRTTFALQTDVTAWLDTVYTLPFMICMPLYGRLGDGFGKVRMFLVGITIFITGTIITLSAVDLPFLMLGRACQGIGAAEIHPLSMAFISEHFSAKEQGKMLGTWSSVGAFTSMICPFIVGFLIVRLGWRVMFGPVLVIGFLALAAIGRQYRMERGTLSQTGFLRTFDWGGVLLLTVAIIMLMFYASSRPITGVEALRDWRLLSAGVVFLSGFLYWETRTANPFVQLAVFRNTQFKWAAVGAFIRKFSMTSMAFVIPLYLTDMYAANAATVGLVLTLHAGALLTTMRLGGYLADRWGSRWPLFIGSILQTGMISLLALLPRQAFLGLVAAGVAGHGLGAGLTLTALDRSALLTVPQEHRGMAAGLFNMIRFGGTAFGAALMGVGLQYGLNRFSAGIQAYQVVFWCVAGVVSVSAILSSQLKS